jgi:hypothetical protein
MTTQIDAREFLTSLFQGDAVMPTTDRVKTQARQPGAWGRRASALLSGIDDDEARACLRYQFEERAAMYEYDAGLPREEAERLAYEHVLACRN